MYQNAPTYNGYLTTLAQAAVADQADSIASFLFPTVKVTTPTGVYKKRDIDAGFRVYNTALSRGSAPTQINTNAEDAFWNSKPHGLEVSNWNWDLDQEGGDDWREDNLQDLISAQLVTREVEAVELFRKAIVPTSGAGIWRAGEGDVIKEFDQEILRIQAAIGKMPTRVAMGLTAWSIIKNHPSVIKRVAGINTHMAMQAFAECLIFPGMEIKVGAIPSQPAKLGKTKDKAEILGSDIIIYYAQDAPTRSDVSAGKDFTLSPAGPEVLTITNDDEMTTKDRMLWSTDRQVACPAAAARILVA